MMWRSPVFFCISQVSCGLVAGQKCGRLGTKLSAATLASALWANCVLPSPFLTMLHLSVGNHFACTKRPLRAPSSFTCSRVLCLFAQISSEPTFLDLQRIHKDASQHVAHDLVWHQVCLPLLHAICFGLVLVGVWVPLHGLRDALMRCRRGHFIAYVHVQVQPISYDSTNEPPTSCNFFDSCSILFSHSC